MTNTIGVNCQLILDGTGYWIEPASFRQARPRIARADLTGTAANPAGLGTGAGQLYVDRGPGKREWTFIIVAFNGMVDYSDSPVGLTGEQIRAALRTSYNKVNTQLTFSSPNADAFTVWFSDMVDELADVRGQIDGCQYYLHTTLIEV